MYLTEITDITYDKKYQGLRLACMGDSQTDALWDGIDYAYGRAPSIGHWTNLFERQTGIPVDNAGHCGDTTQNMLDRFGSDILKISPCKPTLSPYKPTHCVIMGGGNDCFSLVATSTVISNITQMVNMCLANNITPIVMDCPIYYRDASQAQQQQNLIAAMHTAIMSYTSQNSINYINLYNSPLMVNNQQDLTCYLGDKIHINGKGSLVVATALLQYFNTLIA